MAYLIALVLLILLILSIGSVDIYLSREELFDYDRQRIPRQTPEERTAMVHVLAMAALGGAVSAGLFLLILRL